MEKLQTPELRIAIFRRQMSPNFALILTPAVCDFFVRNKVSMHL
jgi:hypothetical protein